MIWKAIAIAAIFFLLYMLEFYIREFHKKSTVKICWLQGFLFCNNNLFYCNNRGGDGVMKTNWFEIGTMFPNWFIFIFSPIFWVLQIIELIKPEKKEKVKK